ncbi:MULTISPECIES: hypothetical protein [Dyella]|uniref:Uncharacterized protein n=2 Tax=Dyella TaxID=231454 RepID=A0A4V2NLE4_9GAMM|nr:MULTISPECIES: hypothetical protein [Dyella]TBR36464.1 hypothetical protein EYV96_10995 [Dyella terrae]TCI08444.1 hypothetical protein EZM97_27875 [Dyella soli]
MDSKKARTGRKKVEAPVTVFTVDELLDDTMGWLYRIRMLVTDINAGAKGRRTLNAINMRDKLDTLRMFADMGLECAKTARLQLSSKPKVALRD